VTDAPVVNPFRGELRVERMVRNRAPHPTKTIGRRFSLVNRDTCPEQVVRRAGASMGVGK
jgi:hypothetical protein